MRFAIFLMLPNGLALAQETGIFSENNNNSSNTAALNASSQWKLNVSILQDIVPGNRSSHPQLSSTFTVYPALLRPPNRPVLFTAHTAESGWEPWILRENEMQAVLLKDLAPGPNNSTFDDFRNDFQAIWLHEDQAIFVADTPEYGTELWTTDGTADGTQLLIDLVPGPVSSEPENMLVFVDRFFLFTALQYSNATSQTIDNATTTVPRRVLYCSNGTSAGTFLLFANPPSADEKPESIFGHPGDVYLDNLYAVLPDYNRIVFMMENQSTVEILGNGVRREVDWNVWATNGTLEGTYPVTNTATLQAERIVPFGLGNPSVTAGSDATASSDSLPPFTSATFRATNVSTGEAGLYTTEHGVTTTFVANLQPRVITRGVLLKDNSVIFFNRRRNCLYAMTVFADDNSTTSAVRYSTPRLLLNGTVSNLYFTNRGPTLQDRSAVLLFVENNTDQVLQLWKTDGTADGTVRVIADLGTNQRLASGYSFPHFNNAFLWATEAYNLPEERSLWMTDGTAEGTSKVFDFDIEEVRNYPGRYFQTHLMPGTSRTEILTTGYTKEYGFEWYRIQLLDVPGGIIGDYSGSNGTADNTDGGVTVDANMTTSMAPSIAKKEAPSVMPTSKPTGSTNSISPTKPPSVLPAVVPTVMPTNITPHAPTSMPSNTSSEDNYNNSSRANGTTDQTSASSTIGGWWVNYILSLSLAFLARDVH